MKPTKEELELRVVMINDIMLRRGCDRPQAVVIFNDVMAGDRSSKDFSVKISAKGKEIGRDKPGWWK